MPTPTTNSGIRDNHKRGVVADFLKAKIHSSSRLSIVSAYFTIYAYEALKDHLDQIDHLDFLFGEPRFITSLDPEKTEKKAFILDGNGLQLANKLQQKRIARECADWIRQKVDIRSIRHAQLLHGKLLDQNVLWRKQLDSKLSQATNEILGDNATRREKALKGIAPASEFALRSACQLLTVQNPQVADIAVFLRSAFDRMLWHYCARKHIQFSVECDAELATQKLWDAAKVGAMGLAVKQPAFVTGIETHADLFLADDPTRDVCAGKTQPELEALCNRFAGGQWKTEPHPRAVMDGF